MKNIIGHSDGQIMFATQSPAVYDFAAPDGMTAIEVDAETYAQVSPTVGQLKFRVDGEKLIPIPDQPGEFHVWDWPSLTWIQDRALAEKTVRAKRATLLSNTVDKINAIRWAAMSESERAEWDTYRTALLDITDQAGFPLDVVWPVAP